MLKNISELEIAIENKIYRFACHMDSPLQHIKEALFQFQKYVGQVEDSVKSQQEKPKESSPDNNETINEHPKE